MGYAIVPKSTTYCRIANILSREVGGKRFHIAVSASKSVVDLAIVVHLMMIQYNSSGTCVEMMLL